MLNRNPALVLAVLERSRGELAGIEVAQALPDLARSSVYAAIAALQRDGLIVSRWDHTQAHPRRMLMISPAGRVALAEARTRLAGHAGRAARTATGGGRS
jgi:DNA-binding PadR family transcriptional regulator